MANWIRRDDGTDGVPLTKRDFVMFCLFPTEILLLNLEQDLTEDDGWHHVPREDALYAGPTLFSGKKWELQPKYGQPYELVHGRLEAAR